MLTPIDFHVRWHRSLKSRPRRAESACHYRSDAVSVDAIQTCRNIIKFSDEVSLSRITTVLEGECVTGCIVIEEGLSFSQ